MSTSPAHRPRVKRGRFVSLAGPGLLRIREGKVTDLYAFRRLPSDVGTLYSVAKVVQADDLGIEYDEPYAVCLDANGEGKHSCECKGHLRHGHKTQCRHVAGLLALRSSGKLN
jgi:hypothetical protein